MTELVLVSLAAVFLVESIAFILSLIIKDSSVADVVWGLGFVAVALTLLIKTVNPNSVQLLTSMLISIWGVRLAFHIGKRKIGKPEDFRYREWRKEWGEWFNLRSYFQNFLFQGLLICVISAGLIIAAYGVNYDMGQWWQFAGIALWVVGFSIEVISDWQLSRFLVKRTNKKETMRTGLWRYSRHPNYFGEVVLWWGLWLLIVGMPYGWWAIISPLCITILIVFVSGVPLLERKYKNNREYQKYSKQTSVFIPLPAKKG